MLLVVLSSLVCCRELRARLEQAGGSNSTSVRPNIVKLEADLAAKEEQLMIAQVCLCACPLPGLPIRLWQSEAAAVAVGNCITYGSGHLPTLQSTRNHKLILYLPLLGKQLS